jgi:hypothetical protein
LSQKLFTLAQKLFTLASQLGALLFQSHHLAPVVLEKPGLHLRATIALA